MASILGNCPACGVTPTYNEIDNITCLTRHYGIDRLIFESADASPVLLTAVPLLATWQAFLALPTTSNQKRAITPVGVMGGGETFNDPGVVTSTNNAFGTTTVIDMQNNPTLTGKFNGLAGSVLEQMRGLGCWATRVWWINTNNEIVGKKVSATEATGFDLVDFNEFWLSTRTFGNGVFIKEQLNNFTLTFADRNFEHLEVRTALAFQRNSLIQL